MLMSIAQIERFYASFYPRWDRELFYCMVEKLGLLHSHLIRNMSCGQRSQVLFPFSIHLESSDGGYLRLFIQPGGWLSVIGLIGSLAGFTLWCRMRRAHPPDKASLLLVAVTGLYGWIAVGLLGPER
jgi:hypothetical protein